MEEKNLKLNDWVSLGFRTMIMGAMSLVVFYFNQNNSALQQSITTLDTTLHSIEHHLTETDKMIIEIKVSRDQYMPKFLEMMNTEDEVRKKLEVFGIKISSIEDVLNRHNLH